MGLGSIVSLAAATFGAAVGAFEGVVHLGGEVRKLSSRELLYGKQPDSVASEADKATPGSKLSVPWSNTSTIQRWCFFSSALERADMPPFTCS